MVGLIWPGPIANRLRSCEYIWTKLNEKKIFSKNFDFFLDLRYAAHFENCGAENGWSIVAIIRGFVMRFLRCASTFYICFAFHMACFVGCNGHIQTCHTTFESLDYIVLPKLFFIPKRIFYGSRKVNNLICGWIILAFSKYQLDSQMKIICFSGPIEYSLGSEKYFGQNYVI